MNATSLWNKHICVLLAVIVFVSLPEVYPHHKIISRRAVSHGTYNKWTQEYRSVKILIYCYNSDYTWENYPSTPLQLPSALQGVLASLSSSFWLHSLSFHALIQLDRSQHQTEEWKYNFASLRRHHRALYYNISWLGSVWWDWSTHAALLYPHYGEQRQICSVLHLDWNMSHETRLMTTETSVESNLLW